MDKDNAALTATGAAMGTEDRFLRIEQFLDTLAPLWRLSPQERAALLAEQVDKATVGKVGGCCQRISDAELDKATRDDPHSKPPEVAATGPCLNFPPDAVVIYRDGNQLCAVRPDFKHLGVSCAGFGVKTRHAIGDLLAREKAVGIDRPSPLIGAPPA